jgi:putative ABC transport system permease protein
VMVSERLARALWPGRSPLGSCLRLGSGTGTGDCAEVVGVAADVRVESVIGEPSAVLYLPSAQMPVQWRASRVFVRTGGDRAQVAAAVRAELQSLHPAMPFVDVEPLDARVRPQLIQWEVGARLFASLGVLAALLGAVGLYSVVSFAVSQRTRELGIRSALGAGRGRLVRAELLGALALSVVGMAGGAVLGLAAARLLEAQLYGLRALDAGTYLGVAALLAVIALLASLRPAWRAAAADPAVVLREE